MLEISSLISIVSLLSTSAQLFIVVIVGYTICMIDDVNWTEIGPNQKGGLQRSRLKGDDEVGAVTQSLSELLNSTILIIL